MKEIFNHWLSVHGRFKGVWACGLRYPDTTTFHQSYIEELPEPELAKTWRYLADTYQVLNLHRIPALRLRWVYANAWIHCVRRSDGILLGLLTSTNPNEVDQAGLETLIKEFEELKGDQNTWFTNN